MCNVRIATWPRRALPEGPLENGGLTEEVRNGTGNRLELVLEHRLPQHYGVVTSDPSSDRDAKYISGVGNERDAVWPVNSRLLCRRGDSAARDWRDHRASDRPRQGPLSCPDARIGAASGSSPMRGRQGGQQRKAPG